ncbi:hypothetical protein Pla175_29840 [Pirellulimonas nuda]|uniref:Ice-binding protein C-terminal domain-containing protein n=1 Tax=Pirellulimonas nuda TaxID=2528009 RepID=A0A518DDU9_9BACT|nr:PEP-CTERM sorting domain-containing protein [Pirellulimonas nuda]QDU89592.1 hypothetical protein Pla175_29840 [Pirellulimonas nuda]
MLGKLSCAALCAALVSFAGGAAADHIWINEFHYDNDGADANEFVEVAVRSGPAFNPADFSVQPYNGNGGATYGTAQPLSAFTVGATSPIAGSVESVTFYSFVFTGTDSNGLQNGAPDGLALVNTVTPSVVEFLSYEGSFMATNGPAMGATSVDIGVSETDDGVLTSLGLVGAGSSAADFTWALIADGSATPGAVNTGQTLGPAAVPEPASIALMALCVAGVVGMRYRLG